MKYKGTLEPPTLIEELLTIGGFLEGKQSSLRVGPLCKSTKLIRNTQECICTAQIGLLGHIKRRYDVGWGRKVGVDLVGVRSKE